MDKRILLFLYSLTRTTPYSWPDVAVIAVRTVFVIIHADRDFRVKYASVTIRVLGYYIRNVLILALDLSINEDLNYLFNLVYIYTNSFLPVIKNIWITTILVS